jgi:tetratricopeptide (TPR) repeat protein
LHFLEPLPVGEQLYQFHHDLIQEAIYHNLWPETRKTLHQQVGAYLETLGAGGWEGRAAQLAYHYAQAEDWAKARDYLVQAGEHARHVAADAEAVQLYQQVLTLCGEHLELPQWISVHRKLGEALYRRGEYGRAEQIFQQALGKGGRSFPTSRWGMARALVSQLLQHASRRVLPRWVLPQVTDHDRCFMAEECLRIHECLGWMDFYTGRRTRQLLGILMGLSMAEQHGHTDDIARGLAALGVTADLLACVRLAGYYHRRAVPWVERRHQPRAVGFVSFCRGYHAECLGLWDTALEHFQRAADAYWDAGDMRGWGSAMTDFTCLLHYQGHFARALAVSEMIITVGQEGADKQVWGWGLATKGWFLGRTGAWEQAEWHLQQALALLRQVPDYFSVVWAGGVLGQDYIIERQMQQACAVLEESRRLSVERRVGGSQRVELCKGLADASLAVAEHATGVARTAALQQAKAACVALRKACTYFPVGLSHAYRAQGTYTWLRGRPARAKKWWGWSLRTAQARGARWDLGMTHFEIGGRLGDVAHLEQAVTILTDLGATVDAANARLLLQHVQAP